MSGLPVAAHREELLAALKSKGVAVLSAPTGSGKSTQVPQFLMGRAGGRVLVLEPRRLSARALAARVASETKTALGAKVGYQVRFDSRCSASTEVVFQTYGVFAAGLARDPELEGVGAVVLDEFHERSLDADLALAWLKSLRSRRPDLLVVVMSATLDGGELAKYWPAAARVDAPGRTFPVDVRHRPFDARTGVERGALGALQDLAREGLDGAALVFMPGLREIRRTMTEIGPFCRERGWDVLPLHGSLEPGEQDRALAPTGKPRVVVCTNVAETGVTVPDAKAVVDSGLHRVAAHDAARGINTLTLARISRANADQRTGRAGRVAPGRCVRLWSKADEAGMSPSLKPEIARLELSSLRLTAAALPAPVSWLTPPPEAAWSAAGAALAALGAERDGRATERGRALLRWPAPPKVAAVLEEARSLGGAAFERACAMAAVFETGGERGPGKAYDLGVLASDLLAGAREELPYETVQAFQQLKRTGERGGETKDGELARVWLGAFSDRLASRDGDGGYYRLADGRGALLPVPAKEAPEVLLALDVRERAGGAQARQIGISLFLPYAVADLRRWFPEECRWEKFSEFDGRAGRVASGERLVFRGLVLERRDAGVKKEDKKAAAALWAEKFASGELLHPGHDDKVKQFLVRVALARRLYPDMGFPEMSADDWTLVYGEVCAGKNSLKDIERVELLPHLYAYLGPALGSFLDRSLPTTKKLPSGKNGRFTYHETNPAELDARLGDFVGLKGTMSLCEGRLPVLFDILAPNFRTVQKTSDLSSFWANHYPTVKKELQRRYPRHPWP